jgi:hypothetical protein
MKEQSDKGGSPKQQPISERLMFLAEMRRHVQLGVVREDIVAAADRIKELEAALSAIESNTGLEERLAASKEAFNTIAKEGLKRADEADSLRSSIAAKPALQQFNECMAEDATPLERLRFFCSIAFKEPQDWLDVEPFFDALEQQLSHVEQPKKYRDFSTGEFRSTPPSTENIGKTPRCDAFFKKLDGMDDAEKILQLMRGMDQLERELADMGARSSTRRSDDFIATVAQEYGPEASEAVAQYAETVRRDALEEAAQLCDGAGGDAGRAAGPKLATRIRALSPALSATASSGWEDAINAKRFLWMIENGEWTRYHGNHPKSKWCVPFHISADLSSMGSRIAAIDAEINAKDGTADL